MSLILIFLDLLEGDADVVTDIRLRESSPKSQIPDACAYRSIDRSASFCFHRIFPRLPLGEEDGSRQRSAMLGTTVRIDALATHLNRETATTLARGLLLLTGRGLRLWDRSLTSLVRSAPRAQSRIVVLRVSFVVPLSGHACAARVPLVLRQQAHWIQGSWNNVQSI